VVREPEVTEEARRALGAELAAYRRAAGYSQAELARHTEYSRSTVANVETGRQHVPRDFWESVDTALRTGGVLAVGSDEIEATARRELRAAARGVSTARQARTRQPDPDNPEDTADLEDADSPTEHPRYAPVSFCLPGLELPGLPTETATPASELVPPWRLPTADSALAASRGDSRPINPGDVARLRSMRQHLKAIDNAHGGGAALPMAAWYLRTEIMPLLNGRHGDSASRNLIEVAAEFQHDAGWAAYDCGRQQLAAEYFTNGLRLAHSAGNRLLGGRILAAMSHQAIYLGHLRQAIDFAQAARTATRQVATPRTIAMLAAMEACAHAAAGDSRQCLQALDDAGNALARITRGQPEPEWLDFDEGGYWGHAARAYRDLGQADEAERCARKSVGLCLAGHSRTRAQRTTIYATAHLSMGEVDAAAAAGEQIVREAWNLHSGHVFGEIAQLVAAIAPSGTPATADFLEQARELLAARAPELATTAT